MASKRVYFEDESAGGEDYPQLSMYKNEEGRLFVCMSQFESHSTDIFLTLSEEDAVRLISELAFQFDLVNDDSMDSGHYFWKGETH